MKPTVRISLVIPVYNQLVHTMQCLESILRLPDKGDEIIVVDNASTDGTPDYLKNVGVTVISNATNLGCAKAWNQGIRASRGAVVGILSNDIVLTPGWLPSLLRFMEQSGHGIVSPAMPRRWRRPCHRSCRTRHEVSDSARPVGPASPRTLRLRL